MQSSYEEECETSPDSDDILIEHDEEIDEDDEDDDDNDENGSDSNNCNNSQINQFSNNKMCEINKNIKLDEDNSECELTNLTWLTELKNITNLAPTDLPVTDPPTTRFNKFITQVRRSRESYENRCELYRTNAKEKPPFNYAHIIAMAMLDEGRMTLKQICKWIQEKFAYYKVNKNWNVSHKSPNYYYNYNSLQI